MPYNKQNYRLDFVLLTITKLLPKGITMIKYHKTLSAILSILFVITTTSITHGANAKIPDTDKNLQNLEKEYPKLVQSWRNGTRLVAETRKLERIFGVPDRALAERKLKKVILTHKSERTKFYSQFSTCQKKITTELSKSRKKLASLEKKKKLTTSMQTRKAELQKSVSELSGMLNIAEDMNHPFPAYRLWDEVQRLRISAGEVARKEVIAYAPKLIKYRMDLQDNIADLEKLQKMDKSKITSADKQKLKKSLQQLKINHKKVTTTATTKKKPLITQIAKLEKKTDSIKLKTEKAEKARRSTDKLDQERLRLIGEVSTLNYQIDLIDKIADGKKAEKLLATIGQ